MRFTFREVRTPRNVNRESRYFFSPMHHRCLWVRMKRSPLATAMEAFVASLPSRLMASNSYLGPAAKTLVVGVERRDGVLCYAGVEVRNRGESGAGGIVVGGRFGGRGQEVLEAANLAATFDPTTWRLHRAIPDDVIEAWRAIDVLAPKLLDAVLVCPRCQGLPTFRAGCKSCGSGRIGGERLIHHFACAHVGPIGDFERPEGVVCPKCRMRNLVVGADYDFQNGPVRCSDCHWRGDAPGQIAQCLACRYRFPGEDARQIEITGYHVHRLDPLAFIAAP